MLANFSPKGIAMAGITFLFAGGIAIVVETTKGELFEIRKSISTIEEAKASNKAAEAQYLDAMNKLKGVLETAAAMNNVGKLQADATVAASIRLAQATRDAAKTAGDSLIIATGVNSHPDNEMYDSMTGPLFGEPTKQMADLNRQIVQSKLEEERGIDSKTGAQLSQVDLWALTRKRRTLEQQLEVLQSTTQKNWHDAMAMMLGSINEGLGGMGGLYPSGNEPAPVRRIVKE
jgi:hypothetical protein